MCESCGCGMPEDDHGDKKHIVLDEVKTAGGPDQIDDGRLEEAADAAEITPERAKQNVSDGYETVSSPRA